MFQICICLVAGKISWWAKAHFLLLIFQFSKINSHLPWVQYMQSFNSERNSLLLINLQLYNNLLCLFSFCCKPKPEINRQGKKEWDWWEIQVELLLPMANRQPISACSMIHLRLVHPEGSVFSKIHGQIILKQLKN